MKNLLIAITFTVFLLFIKDHLDIVGNILSGLMGILTPFLIGFLIAYILNFPYKFFCNKVFGKMGTKRKFFKRFVKPLSLVSTFLLAFAIIVALILIVVPQIVTNVSGLAKNMPEYMEKAYIYIDGSFKWINSIFHTSFSLDNTLNQFMEEIKKILNGQNLVTTADATKNVLDFLIIAFSIFLCIKGIAKMSKKKEEEPAAPAEPAPKPDDVVLLEEIRDLLKKQ